MEGGHDWILPGGLRHGGAHVQWLVDTSDLFGLPVQNWLLLVAAGLGLYVIVLTIAHRFRRAQ